VDLALSDNCREVCVEWLVQLFLQICVITDVSCMRENIKALVSQLIAGYIFAVVAYRLI
jgi:hypothetical protein